MSLPTFTILLALAVIMAVAIRRLKVNLFVWATPLVSVAIVIWGLL